MMKKSIQSFMILLRHMRIMKLSFRKTMKSKKRKMEEKNKRMSGRMLMLKMEMKCLRKMLKIK